MNKDKNRVVITGIGVVSPIGTGLDCFFEALSGGESGIFEISTFDHSGYPAHTAAVVEDFDVDEYLPSPKNYLDRNTELSFGAFKLALDDANLDLEKINKQDVALCWGNAFGGTETMNLFFSDVQKKGPRFAKPILFPHTYSNTAISALSIEYGLNGPHLNFSSGWLSSSYAIAYGYDLIKTNRAQLAFVGGAEAFGETIFKYCLGHDFLVTGEKEKCCPFDSSACGTVAGEGAGMLVLENINSAVARKADIHAEICGTGMHNYPGG